MDLKMLIYTHNITSTEVARKMGVSRQALSHWVTGKVLPNEANVKRLADAIGVTPDEIYDAVVEGKKRRAKFRKDVS